MASQSDPSYQIDLQVLDSDDLQVVDEIKALILDNLSTNKEAWLLYSLLDYYARTQSERCMEVLTSLDDHHVKHLYDKLHEHMKGNHRLSTFNLLAYLVRKQQPWLHSLVSHHLFNSILKCLKVDTDIPVLLGGVLFITALLPLVPLAIVNHLGEIFDIFTRLASFNIRKPVGNIPDIYLLHLHVGVDCLFHRLYGMYPCHFLTYLRAYCIKKENIQVFDEVIKPMCDRVKMHPLLVTMSRDKEIETTRWRKMDVHDIVEECARLSLDVTQYHHEIERKHLGPLPQHNKMIVDAAIEQNSQLQIGKPQIMPSELADSFLHRLSNMADKDSMWSPSVLCGLATPPPSQSVTPAGSLVDIHANSSASVSASNTPGMFVTPVSTPLESPLLTDENRASGTVSQPRNLIKKTSASNIISKGFSLLDSPMSPMTDIHLPASSIVLPSPLKRDFTTEPPQHAYKTKAMRKLPLDDSVDFQDAENQPTNEENENHAERPKIITASNIRTAPLTTKFSIDKIEDSISTSKAEENNAHDSTDREKVKEDETEDDAMTSSTHTVMSVHSLQDVIESLDHLAPQDFEDKEVSELTQEHGDTSSTNSESYDEFPNHLKGLQDTEMTAESVAQFMKNVNRIRFNSMNIDRSVMQEKVEKTWKYVRSRSCPQFEPENEEIDGLENNGENDDNNDNVDAYNGESKMFSISMDATSKDTEHLPGTVSQPEMVTTTRTTVSTKVVYSRSTSMTYGQHFENRAKPMKPLMPYEELFPFALPNAAQLGSYTENVPPSSSQSPSKTQGKGPVPFSPAEILDRFLLLGGEVHAKELSQIPLSSQQTVSWTHFGDLSVEPGRPPADEVNILRGQILLLHSQLMFERHKRELHAKRNRRLLGKLVKATALEEQNAAMRDTLRLQENEINNLNLALGQEQQRSRLMKDEMDNAKHTHEIKVQSFAEQVEMLQIAKKKLHSDLLSSCQKNDHLLKEIQSVKAELFNKERECENMKKQASFSEDLKVQLEKMNKEVLLMGELIQRYQDKVQALKYRHRPRPEIQMMLDSAKNELSNTKAQLEQKCVQVEATTARLVEVDDQLRIKDELVNHLKKDMEEMKSIHSEEVMMLDDKYKGQKKIQIRLQEHILDLMNRLERSRSHKPSENSAESSYNKTSGRSSNDKALQTRDFKEASPDKQMDHLPVKNQYATPRCTPSPVSQSASNTNIQSAFRVYQSPDRYVTQQTSSTGEDAPGGAAVVGQKMQADELAQEAEFMSDSESSSQLSQNSTKTT